MNIPFRDVYNNVIMWYDLIQLITICTYGNMFLYKRGCIPPEFTKKNTTFSGCVEISFLNSRNEIITTQIEKWYQYLQEGNCKGLRLYYIASSSRIDPGRFNGETDKWLVEALYDGFSNYWMKESRYSLWEKGVGFHRNNRYKLIYKAEPTTDIQLDTRVAKEALRKSVKDSAAFAYHKHTEGWGKWFDEARQVLESDEPETYFYHTAYRQHYHTDILPGDYPVIGKQLLFGALLSIVKSGMGGWDDIWFREEADQTAFEQINNRRVNAFINAILAGVNSCLADR